MASQHAYPLGYTPEEANRLQVQAELLGEVFEDALRRAGLREGMRVLDLGCGVGDVSFLAARLVGPSGAILGVDQSEPSLIAAKTRATHSEVTNVSFKTAKLETYDPDETFDAIIGRFVLLYLPDPAGVLKRLRSCLRPGGIVVMQELDMSVASQYPASDLFTEVNRWIFSAFEAGGAEKDMGRKLLSTFLAAGLPWPELGSVTPLTSGENSAYYAMLTEMVRSMLPLIERTGLTTRAGTGLETLTRRLRDDAVANKRALFPPRIVSAWSSVI